MNELTSFEVPSSLEGIAAATQQAETWLEQREAGAAAIHLTSLAIEELLTNCMKYGYDDANKHAVEIQLAIENGELSITIADDGHAFDPLQAAAPDLSVPLEERAIGGLGLHLLREMSDTMSYARQDDKNRVTLRKRL